MESKERALAEKYMRPGAVVLEYGSGGSTLHFSRLVAQYYSIEHNTEWCGDVEKKINHLNLNVSYHCVPTNNGFEACPGGNNCLSHYKDFTNYIEEPSKWGVKFDVVLIDGRARAQCAVFIRDYLKDEQSVG